MGGDVGPHRADHGKVVGVGCGLGEDLADLEAGCAVFFKLKRRTHRDASVGQIFVVKTGEDRLGVPGVDVGWSALGKDVDDGFGFAREMRGLGKQRARTNFQISGDRGLGDELGGYE